MPPTSPPPSPPPPHTPPLTLPHSASRSLSLSRQNDQQSKRPPPLPFTLNPFARQLLSPQPSAKTDSSLDAATADISSTLVPRSLDPQSPLSSCPNSIYSLIICMIFKMPNLNFGVNNLCFRNVFDPRQMRISVQGSGIYLNRERGCNIDPLCIDDPLFLTNNVGRNCFRIHQCIKA